MKNRKQQVKESVKWEDSPEILSTYQVAELLGCGYSAVLGLILRNEIPYKKVGIAYKIPKQGLFNWFNKESNTKGGM